MSITNAKAANKKYDAAQAKNNDRNTLNAFIYAGLNSD